jgi:hypothetical protein
MITLSGFLLYYYCTSYYQCASQFFSPIVYIFLKLKYSYLNQIQNLKPHYLEQRLQIEFFFIYICLSVSLSLCHSVYRKFFMRKLFLLNNVRILALWRTYKEVFNFITFFRATNLATFSWVARVGRRCFCLSFCLSVFLSSYLSPLC